MRHEIEDGFDPLQCSLGEWYFWMEYAKPKRQTPQKILVPLDRSIRGAEQVLSVAQGLLDADGEGILLRVIPSSSTRMTSTSFISGSQLEKHERSKALGFLKYFGDRLGDGRGRWRYDVTVSDSIADGIADFAAREEVDLIAMYTHDRKGLAKLIKGSVTEQVQRRVSTEMRIVRPQEMAAR